MIAKNERGPCNRRRINERGPTTIWKVEPADNKGRGWGERSKSLKKHTRTQHSAKINKRKPGNKMNLESTIHIGQNKNGTGKPLLPTPHRKKASLCHFHILDGVWVGVVVLIFRLFCRRLKLGGIE